MHHIYPRRARLAGLTNSYFDSYFAYHARPCKPPLTLDLGLLLPSLASEASVPLWASLQDHARSFSLSDPAPGSWCRIRCRCVCVEAARTVTLSQAGRATLLFLDANVHLGAARNPQSAIRSPQPAIRKCKL
jgi:hypothetical protein